MSAAYAHEHVPFHIVSVHALANDQPAPTRPSGSSRDERPAAGVIDEQVARRTEGLVPGRAQRVDREQRASATRRLAAASSCPGPTRP